MNPGEPLAIGQLLDGRYRIHKVLGQGGMGRVYLANDTRLANRPVAAKEMIIGDGVQEKKAIEDFSREASVLARLSHPSIPQIIDYFAERGRHYLVMEYVAGGDLQDHLDRLGPKGRFPEAKVLRWARQILEVLQFLHGQKPPIVYRDLKPGNIMIDHHGRAMLIDFGIARFLPPGGRGTQIGSIGYAPPEQYMGKMEPRSDLYALAATMHHLLTGRDPQLEPPFSFPPLRSLAPEVSMQTERVTMSALDKDIEKRPKSAREMLDLLPKPEADDSAGNELQTLSGNSQRPSPSGMSTMATIFLGPPLPRTHLPTPPPRQSASAAIVAASGGELLARASTQRSLGQVLAQPVKASSTAKTQDLGLRGKSSSDSLSTATPAASVRASGKVSAPSRLAAALSSVRAAVVPKVTPSAPIQRLGGSVTDRGAAGFGENQRSGANRSAAASPQQNGYAAGPATHQPAAAAWLVAPSDGRRFALGGGRTVIGRVENPADSVDVNLVGLTRGMDRVSRRHAEIIKQGADYFIRDLGSLNGTYIGGRGRLGRDQLYKLKDRDEIVLGGAKLEFRKG